MIVNSDGFKVSITHSQTGQTTNVNHEMNNAIQRLRMLSPKSIDVTCPSDNEFGLFETLVNDGVEVTRRQ